MKKDWTDLLREKLESYTPDVPKASFEEIREKMLAAGAAAGAGAGAPKGASVPMRRGLRWLAYAASLAAVVAGGALLLRDRGDQPSGLADAGQQEVVAVEKSAAEVEPAIEDIAPANEGLEGVSEPVSEPVSTPSNNVVKPTVVKQVSVTKKDVQPLLADAGKAADVSAPATVNSTVPEERVTPVQESKPEDSQAPVQESKPEESQASAQESKPEDSHAPVQESKPATDPVYNTSLADLGSDPFAEPVEPIRKQLKRFSLGASGILAANASARGDKANPNDLSVTTDRLGNKYFEFGAPEIQYHYTAPVSGGISLRYHFTNQFYAETGMRFTYLRTWVTPSGAQQNLLFAGIPVGLGARIASLGNFDLYGSAYGMGSKCIYGSETPNYPCNYTTLDEIPLMWSVGVSPGAEYHITPLVGIYAEPTLSYYFKNEKAPNTLYKDNPLYFTVNVGVRFNM